MDGRVEAVDGKIRKLDGELLRIKDQLNRCPEGPSRDSLRRQAMQILQQKKQYENQRATMQAQSFNLEQANFTVESMQSTAQTVQVMKSTAKDMRKTLGKMDIGKVEDLRDEMEDLMMESNEINEVLARSYGMPGDLDEADLEAELGMLQDLQEMEDTPSYLSELPAAPSSATRESGSKSAMAEPQS